MYAQMDTVDGAQVRKSTTSGYFVRTGNLYIQNGDLPALKANADSRTMLNGFGLTNVPKEGDKLNNTTYKNWICVDRQIVPRSALIYQIICVYRWLGSLQIRDHTSLEQINTVVNAGTKKPIYNTWTDPHPAPGTTARTIKKLCRFPRYRALRSMTYTKTVNFTARVDVLHAKNTCNEIAWMSYGPGWWLVSDVTGDTFDAGLTYTYSVTFTTRDEISWAEYDVLEDDRGFQVYVDPAAFNTLVTKPYVGFSEDNTTCPGVVRHDPYGTTNFVTIFGIGPGESSTTDLSGIM